MTQDEIVADLVKALTKCRLACEGVSKIYRLDPFAKKLLGDAIKAANAAIDNLDAYMNQNATRQ